MQRLAANQQLPEFGRRAQRTTELLRCTTETHLTDSEALAALHVVHCKVQTSAELHASSQS